MTSFLERFKTEILGSIEESRTRFLSSYEGDVRKILKQFDEFKKEAETFLATVQNLDKLDLTKYDAVVIKDFEKKEYDGEPSVQIMTSRMTQIGEVHNLPNGKYRLVVLVKKI